jgi:hypothetical protein
VKYRSFSPGDLVVKVDWLNKHLDHGIVIQRESLDWVIDVEVVFPSGPRWESATDLIHLDEVHQGNK